MEIANDIILVISDYLDIFSLNYLRSTCKKYYQLFIEIAKKRNPKLWRLHINLNGGIPSAKISPKNSNIKQFIKSKYDWIKDIWIISNKEWYTKYKSPDDYYHPKSLMLEDVLRIYYSVTMDKIQPEVHIWIPGTEGPDGCLFLPFRISNYNYYSFKLDENLPDEIGFTRNKSLYVCNLEIE